MKIISETSLDRFEAWSGGRDTLDVLIEKDLCDQLEAMLENDIFPDGCTDTELNDLLWFERDNIAEWLGFSDWEALENGEEDEEEDEDADRSDCVYTYVYGWKEENKRKELAEVIGCDEDEVVMFKYCGVVDRSVYSRV